MTRVFSSPTIDLSERIQSSDVSKLHNPWDRKRTGLLSKIAPLAVVVARQGASIRCATTE